MGIIQNPWNINQARDTINSYFYGKAEAVQNTAVRSESLLRIVYLH